MTLSLALWLLCSGILRCLPHFGTKTMGQVLIKRKVPRFKHETECIFLDGQTLIWKVSFAPVCTMFYLRGKNY